MTATTTDSPIAAEFSRSWLLVSARGDLDGARTSSADQIIIDLEDGVDPHHREHARAHVTTWLELGNHAWIRINEYASPDWKHDITALAHLPGIDGVMLAKTEAPEHVRATHTAFGRHTPVIALIETAVGIEEATAIARTPGTFRLAFGSGDYRRDTGTAATDMAMSYPRSRLVVASRVARLPGPIDGPSVTDDEALLRAQTASALSLGMTGRLCLAPAHTAPINATMSPSRADLMWAERFLAEFDNRGRVVRDGSDLPRLKRAQHLTEMASIFHL